MIRCILQVTKKRAFGCGFQTLTQIGSKKKFFLNKVLFHSTNSHFLCGLIEAKYYCQFSVLSIVLPWVVCVAGVVLPADGGPERGV